jgi:hypothetical protein
MPRRKVVRKVEKVTTLKRVEEIGLIPTDSDELRAICIACGTSYPVIKCRTPAGEIVMLSNHHCDPKKIKSIESRRVAHGTLGRQQPRSFGSRLKEAEDMYRSH